jgi:quercetin dioxygenase-like cupin family protein
MYRTFHQELDSSELVWHRDRKDRYVTVVKGQGWEFQLDNQLPLELTEGIRIFIPKEYPHRLIKGISDLIILIEEN